MKKAIGYCRVSTEEQKDNTSLTVQKEKIEAFAKCQDIEIVAMFQDVSSGNNANRKGYKAMLKFIEENEVDYLIVAKLDRSHRHLKNLLEFNDFLQEKGIDFTSVAELVNTSTSHGRLLFQMMGSFAEFEHAQTKERTTSGRKSKLRNISKKQSAGGRIPLGYNKKYNIVQKERDIVANLYKWYLQYGSLAKVKKQADLVGYTGKNNKGLSRQAIHIIITNRFYLGEYHYDGNKERHGKIVEEHHSPIVSKNMFGRVQKALKRNSKQNRKPQLQSITGKKNN